MAENGRSATTFLMFLGQYRHTLDEKGRVAIPVKFRGALTDGAIVTRGLDQSLFLYPRTQWIALAEKLAQLPLGQADTRAFARLMLAGAMEVELDTSGRVLLPEYLRTYAHLSKEMVVVGLYDRIELWDASAWEAYATRTEAEGNAIAERLSTLGL